MLTTILACLFVITLLSGPASAYLDPGSGSMLVAGLVGLLSSLLFFLKGLYHKRLRGILGTFGRAISDATPKHRLVFYSEGRQYWSTFRPLIDELVRRNESCLYLTSDEHDPGLLYTSELVTTQFIGTGTKAYARLTMLEADVCAMTTGGLDVLQIKRSKGVKHYIHLIHAPTDVGTYKQYSFDYFDSVFVSGEHQIRSLRKLEELRRTPRKQLCKVGCLYYDELLRQLREYDSPKASGNRTVLVAPTWGQNGLLKRLGTQVLVPLLDRQWKIILRPHPQSYLSERDMLDRIREEVRHYSNLAWDDENEATQSMAAADVLVSDLSGIVFDFAFLFEKPVITLKYDVNKIGQEAADLPWDSWELTVIDTVGVRIESALVNQLPDLIEQELKKSGRREAILRLREEAVVNFGFAAKDAVGELLRIRDNSAGKAVQ
jgi:CDP-Glycerol:Poly(glycerophosphate) glycerophosphotransferase